MFLTDYIFIALFIWSPIALYLWGLHRSLYWKRKKIPSIPSKPLIGSVGGMLSFKKCVAQQFSDFYFDKKTKEKPFVGIHMFHKPAIVLRDPELIKRVLVKDFTSFPDRYCSADEHQDILGNTNLFFLNSPAWNDLRSRLTPLFSSGKMKNMFYLMKNIGDQLYDTIQSFKTKSFCIDVKDLCTRYTVDVIASCAYGLEANSLKYPQGDFVTYGKKIFEFKVMRAFELLGVFFFPEVVSPLRLKVFSKETSNFLRGSINYVLSEREKNGNTRQDLIDTLLTLKNEDKGKTQNDPSRFVFQGDVLVAQAAAFFTGGYETSSSVMSFALYELCWKPDIQKRLKSEIREFLSKSNGELNYEEIQNMNYLNMVVQESLRMYPSLPFLDRICTATKGYSLEPFDNFIIPKGMQVIVPIYAIQRDPENFPNPNEFDPERFSAENKNKIKPYTFMSFGMGPRACIGERFGLMQTKIGLINFFKNHTVQPSESTPKIMELEKRALVLQAKGGIMLNIIRDS
ncbi:putative cytochrome P450 6g2 [Pseudolycoriella hygida]|uniref:Cytochrome P450 6g2 n=1 Tax=Pseudolycoriella hygida TaxID=35572 RepID=A0A9Q0N0F5_9DIPT|nr:putative cytochrome P450 6g2 [Pseudolycoriella hygida]